MAKQGKSDLGATPETKHRRLISPKMEVAFTPEVLKMVVEDSLGSEFQPHLWEAFDDAFLEYLRMQGVTI